MQVKEYLFSLYNCRYGDFFVHLARVEQDMKEDRYTENHYRYYVREMRILAYTQLLESYRSLTLAYMAQAFGVTEDYIDRELARFIAAGRLHCRIDKVFLQSFQLMVSVGHLTEFLCCCCRRHNRWAASSKRTGPTRKTTSTNRPSNRATSSSTASRSCRASSTFEAAFRWSVECALVSPLFCTVVNKKQKKSHGLGLRCKRCVPSSQKLICYHRFRPNTSQAEFLFSTQG